MIVEKLSRIQKSAEDLVEVLELLVNKKQIR